MSEFPRFRPFPQGLAVLSTQGNASVGSIPLLGGGGGNAAWPSANRAIFVPFRISTEYTFNSFVVDVGSAAGNIDVGVYSADGTKIISTGSTAASANIQQISCTSTTLKPGLYYLALAASSTSFQPQSFTLSLTSSVGVMRAMGISQQASALPLPATATFAAMASSSIPIFGITNRSTV